MTDEQKAWAWDKLKSRIIELLVEGSSHDERQFLIKLLSVLSEYEKNAQEIAL